MFYLLEGFKMEYLEQLAEFYNCSLQKLRIYVESHGTENAENYAMQISEHKTGYYLDTTGGF